ncbi:MAG: TlpA family protein disulfide reductase [Balneolales bacterium]|nr:TlpA family protein disulfide reductase [Balneolales bacterium]
MLKYFLTLFLLLAFSTVSAVAQNNSSLTEQQISAVENAVFTDWDGNEFTLADFAGKTVLIDFWETWCGPCIAVMPTLQQLQDDFPDNFVVLAVSPGWSDTEEVVRRFISQNDYEFVFVHNNELASKLEIRGIPYKVYVQPDGSFYKTEQGSSGPAREYQSIKTVIQSQIQ